MTTKQFTLDNGENGLCKCILMNGEEIPTCEVVKLLNELHEENKELRLLVDTLKKQNMKFKLRLKDLGVEYL